jgi:hypothetical protein
MDAEASTAMVHPAFTSSPGLSLAQVAAKEAAEDSLKAVNEMIARIQRQQAPEQQAQRSQYQDWKSVDQAWQTITKLVDDGPGSGKQSTGTASPAKSAFEDFFGKSQDDQDPSNTYANTQDGETVNERASVVTPLSP